VIGAKLVGHDEEDILDFGHLPLPHDEYGSAAMVAASAGIAPPLRRTAAGVAVDVVLLRFEKEIESTCADGPCICVSRQSALDPQRRRRRPIAVTIRRSFDTIGPSP
jgi:hypothetical protein